MIWFGLVWFYGTSDIVCYLMPYPLVTYILNIWLCLVWFYGTSTIEGYLMPYQLYTYILNIYDFVWFYGTSTIVGYLMPNPLYTYILNIWFSLVLWHIKHCTLFNAISLYYIYIRYMIWFGLVWFYGTSTIVGYLMPNPVYSYISEIFDL